MSSITLHPFGSGPVRNRALAPVATTAAAEPAWQRLAAHYWAGWQHYSRAIAAEVDQQPRFPLPSDPPAAPAAAPAPASGRSAPSPRWIVIR